MNNTENLHFGEMVKNEMLQRQINVKEFCRNELPWSYTGFRQKLTKENFGDIFDLILISIKLNKDFITPALLSLKANGIKIDILNEYENLDQILAKNKVLKEDITLYKNIIKRLNSTEK